MILTSDDSHRRVTLQQKKGVKWKKGDFDCDVAVWSLSTLNQAVPFSCF